MWTCPADKRKDTYPRLKGLPPEVLEAILGGLIETELPPMSDETKELMRAFKQRPARIDHTIICCGGPMTNPTLFAPRYDGAAAFSPDRLYRYALYRTWDEAKPRVMFIGLNPSTADESVDDPTIRRCRNYAFDWGYGGLIMGNLFALRATKPKVMMAHVAPIGPENNYWLERLAREAEIVVAAWGVSGSHLGRDKVVLGFMPQMRHLGLTKAGAPKHPLYLKANTKPQIWRPHD